MASSPPCPARAPTSPSLFPTVPSPSPSPSTSTSSSSSLSSVDSLDSLTDSEDSASTTTTTTTASSKPSPDALVPSPSPPPDDTLAMSAPSPDPALEHAQDGLEALDLNPRDHALPAASSSSDPARPAASAAQPDPSSPGDAAAPSAPVVDAQVDAVKQKLDTHQPTAVLTEEAASAASTTAPSPAPTAASPAQVPHRVRSSALSPGAASPVSPPAAATSPPPSSSSSPAQPPPLYPRASAPPAPTGAARRPLAPGAGGALKAGVRGAVPGAGGPLKMPPSLAAKMAAMTSRSSNSGTPLPTLRTSSSSSGPSAGGAPPAHRPPPRPPAGPASAPAPGGRIGATGPLSGAGARAPSGMAARRRGPGAGLTLSQMGVSGDAASPFASPGPAGSPAGGAPRTGMAARRGVGMRLPGAGADDGAAEEPGSPTQARSPGQGGTPFSNFRKIVDPSGRLNFAQKAILHADGVDFSSGASFKIKMDDFELFEELGKGNYGTVQKVLHRPTGVTMALKEIRLELDDSKLKTIITELDILHRATSPWIIDFYGAFFIESCVYYCMEFMDAGSLDFFAGCDMPEDVLVRVTRSMVEGLKFLKDHLKIMHRDVKPTNVLLNTKGAVKLCDFGVSGQLDRSLAKTNIGCQSYMAPERIKGESQGAVVSYTAASDVWSLGLSIIEAAVGHYPFPEETYSSVFAQLTAIVHGDPPTLPDKYSPAAHAFVGSCLIKDAARRPTYKQLIDSEWLRDDPQRDVDMVGWIQRCLEYRKEHPKVSVTALA